MVTLLTLLSPFSSFFGQTPFAGLLLRLDAAFLLTVGSFLLTVELFYLQLTNLAFLLPVGAFSLTLLACLLRVGTFLLIVGKYI